MKAVAVQPLLSQKLEGGGQALLALALRMQAARRLRRLQQGKLRSQWVEQASLPWLQQFQLPWPLGGPSAAAQAGRGTHLALLSAAASLVVDTTMLHISSSVIGVTCHSQCAADDGQNRPTVTEVRLTAVTNCLITSAQDDEGKS